jgi:hypothetical protein
VQRRYKTNANNFAHDRGGATLPVFALSGERHDLAKPETGFAGHFLKPIDLDTLVRTLAALPRRRSA